MKYIKAFYQIKDKKDIRSNIKSILLIICSSLVLTLFTGALEYTKVQYGSISQDSIYINLKLGSVQTIFKISIMSFFVIAYYNLLDRYKGVFYKIRLQGASIGIIRLMIALKAVLHIIVSLPISIIVNNLASTMFENFLVSLIGLDVASEIFKKLEYPIEIAILVIATAIVFIYKIGQSLKRYSTKTSELMQGDEKLEIRFDS